MAGDDIPRVVGGYREILEALAEGRRAPTQRVRESLGGMFTRGHFVRPV